jgi:indoleamine 2,3-dioxygenase
MADFSSWKRWESKYENSWFSCIPGKNGFLPVQEPLFRLPERYSIINKILDDMKINRADGTKGYLHQANRSLGSVIDNELPLFDISKEDDVQLIAALQRDYYFLAAAYSLETAHPNEGEGNYHKARTTLPKQLAIPLLALSKINKVFPWLDYAHGYGLNNAVLKNASADPTKWDSYKTIRTFNGCASEEGFINVHVAMVAQSGDLLQHQQDTLHNLSLQNRDEFNKSLNNHFLTFTNIIATLQTMWKASKQSDYLSFRTFIMGQMGNKLTYPDETITFVTDEGEETHSYRGETGAQDSIVPSVDNFLNLSYPENKLTEYLFQLRAYRPADHQEYINFVGESSKGLKFREYVFQDSYSCILLLKNLNCLRMFRKKHWNLTKKYIIENTKHPVATGGTPITTWLPNQLGATLEYMQEVVDHVNINDLTRDDDKEYFTSLKIELSDHIQSIMDEVRNMQRDFDDQAYNSFTKRS